MTLNPKLKKITQIMKKLEHILYEDKSAKRLFTTPQCKKIKWPSKRRRGPLRWDNSRCQVCNNIEEIDKRKYKYTRKTVDRYRLRWSIYKKSNTKF